MFVASWSVLNPPATAECYNKQTPPVCFSLWRWVSPLTSGWDHLPHCTVADHPSHSFPLEINKK